MHLAVDESHVASRGVISFRRGIIGMMFMLTASSGLEAQATPRAAAEAQPDATAVAQAGVRDGAQAAELISTRHAFAGGMASGLLGPLWGLLVVVPIANRAVMVRPAQRAAMADTTLVYSRSFQQAFASRVRSRRRGAAIRGNLIISIPLVLLVAASGGM